MSPLLSWPQWPGRRGDPDYAALTTGTEELESRADRNNEDRDLEVGIIRQSA
jgi:hypothetical protein